MTISRSGGGSTTLLTGEMLTLLTANNKVLNYKIPSVTVL
jgi:hypothetical protein